MLNKKGQSLVEFIIILPVIIFILMIIVDFMMILSYKNNIESKIDGVVSLYKDNKTLEIDDYLNKDLDNASYQIKSDDKYTYIEVKMQYNFITPGLSSILGKDYSIKSERVILSE